MVRIKIKYYKPSSLRFLLNRVFQSTLRSRMRVRMSRWFSSSMKGPALVSLGKKVRYKGKEHVEDRLHGEDNNANTPTIYKTVVPFSVVLFDNFRCQITWSSTHGLVI